ncbi:MAG: metallophosphoesterase family protein [Spirulinaceae cyanobacterium]
MKASTETLLSDPFLQLPQQDSVRVVWFTEFEGSRHYVSYGEDTQKQVEATTTKLTHLQEDQKSLVGEQTEEGQIYQKPQKRDIWRHEAEVTGLKPNTSQPYFVSSVDAEGGVVSSETFTLASKPQPGTPLKILLTSDHQSKPMVAANLEKVEETIGKVDGIFFAGDLVNIPDRASEWFDDNRGGAFFPALQGRASYELTTSGSPTPYQGGQLIQNAPLYTAIGNHEVMGRRDGDLDLNQQFEATLPRFIAEKTYLRQKVRVNPQNDSQIKEAWIKSNSFNTETYQELFTLPISKSGQEKYYAVTFGDVRLVVLYATRIWRVPGLNPKKKGKYRETEEDVNSPQQWGYGQHIFEPIQEGSNQYQWLKSELQSPEFNQAKYKIVMFHHPPHSLGENVIPAYTDPVQIVERDEEEEVTAVRYEYPQDQDHLLRDIVPLLEKAGVQLVHYGHSHLWNRFVGPKGMHFLETSNVGNSYGAYLGDKKRKIPKDYQENYVATGNPGGLEPVVPNLAPLKDEAGKALPYIASNEITVFSILDTGKGTVTSYYFDTRKPESEVVEFDQFSLLK